MRHWFSSIMTHYARWNNWLSRLMLVDCFLAHLTPNVFLVGLLSCWYRVVWPQHDAAEEFSSTAWQHDCLKRKTVDLRASMLQSRRQMVFDIYLVDTVQMRHRWIDKRGLSPHRLCRNVCGVQTQIQFDHLQKTVRPLVLSDLIWERNWVCFWTKLKTPS